MFKVGDRVVCINNYYDHNLQYIDIHIGETYIIKHVDNKTCMCILENITGYLNINRFISIKEYRKQKLQKICLESEIE